MIGSTMSDDRRRPRSQSVTGGMHFDAGEPGKPWRITIDTIDALRAAFGDELLNAFVRCFAAADRLMTIVDCMAMNRERLPSDSVRSQRNHNQTGQQIVRRDLVVQPTITVRPGFSVNVIVNKDMVVPPYPDTASTPSEPAEAEPSGWGPGADFHSP